jgi:hypothetical protein
MVLIKVGPYPPEDDNPEDEEGDIKGLSRFPYGIK